MTSSSGLPQDESLGQIVTGLVDDAKAYARAEIEVARQSVLLKVGEWRSATILFVIALLLLQAGLVVLAAAVGMTLAIWLGTAGGLAAGSVLVLAVAAILAWMGAKRLSTR